MKRVVNVVRYLFVFLLNFYVMTIFHSYVSFLFMIGMILFPVYSIAGARCITKGIKPQILPPVESMYKGEAAILHFKLVNPSFFVMINAVLQVEISNTFYGEKNCFSLNLPVRAKGESRTDWKLDLECCGHITVKITGVTISDLLGIYEKKKDVDVRADFLILPRGDAFESEAEQMYLTGVAETAESRNKGYDFSEISGIREYIPGDKLQNIHWKLSAKQKELMVKERVSVSAMQLNIVLDLEDDEDGYLESVLEKAAGVTGVFVRRNLPFTVYYYSVNLGKLCSVPVGSRQEQVQWLEQMMYDHCCARGVDTEGMFIREYPGVPYLYIGMEKIKEDR